MPLLPAGPGGPPPGPACVLADKGPGDVLMAVGSQHESVGGRRALPRIRPYSTLEVRNARVKLCVPWLVRSRGLRGEPAGCATVDVVSSLGVSGPSTGSLKVDPLLLCERDRAEMGHVRPGRLRKPQRPMAARPPVHAGLPACADSVLTCDEAQL